MRRKKFSMAQFNKSVWQKNKLWNKYRKIKNYPLTVIKAGPGYGKTVTTAAFFNSQYSNSCYWYSIDKVDFDLKSFILNLIYSFKIKEDKLGNEAIKLLKTDKEEIRLRAVIKSFSNDLTDYLKQDTFVVLDNFSLVIDNQQISNFLAHFMSWMPDCLHLVIISREEMRFKKWSQWCLKQQALLITEKDLTLNKDEISVFLNAEYNLQLMEEELTILSTKTEGWIMVLDLIGRNLERGDRVKDIFSNYNKSFSLLFDYLESEILVKQSAKVKNFLLQTAILEELDPEICNKLLKINDAEEILMQLKDKELFIIDLGNDYYRYHYLFREFLLAQGEKELNYRQLHRQAASLFLELGSEKKSLQHSLKAKDYKQVAKLIIRSADSLLTLNNLGKLQAILDRLPEKVFYKYPALFVYQGDIYRLVSKFDEAIKFYQQAKKCFKQNHSQVSLGKTYQKIALVFLDTMQPNEVTKYLKKVKKLISRKDVEQQTYLQAMLAENQANKGNLIGAKKHYQENNINNQFLSAWIKLRSGELDQVEQILEKEMQKLNKENRTYKGYKEPVLLLAKLYSFKGEYKKAKDTAKEALDLAQQLNSSLVELLAYTNLGHAYQLSYQITKHTRYFRQAHQVYFKAIDIADDINWEPGKAQALLGLSFLEAFYGKTSLGIKYASQGLEICKQTGDKWLEELLKITLAINWYFSDDLGKAKNLFVEAKRFFGSAVDTFAECICNVWLALITYKQKSWEDFTIISKELFTTIPENNYEFLFLRPNFLGSLDPQVFTPILLEAVKRGIKPDYVSRLTTKLGVNNLNRHPGYTLGIRTFGNLRVWRGHRKINNKKWNRTKVKELFQLFIIHRKELITKERIYSFLWPQASEEKAYRNFYVTLNKLNAVLEPDRKSRENPFFIIRRGSAYGLNKNASYCLDVERFEQLINKGSEKFCQEEEMKHYEVALEFYKDDLFTNILYVDWIREERQRLKNLFLNTADKLAKYYYQCNQLQECIRVCDRILGVDNCWEEAYVLKMKVYHQLEQRSMFIKEYKRYKSVLKHELDILPTPEIKKMYKKISNRIS